MTENHVYKIMIVEDEAVIALGLEQILIEMGYDVAGIAYSGEEAVEKARSLKPELILMDIILSGKLDGIAAAKIIKAELNVPVIFLTAFSEEKIIKRATKAEPYGYILKPFQDREIRAAIEVALYKKEMEDALRKSKARYRAVIESQAEMICRFLPDGTLTFVNDAYCRYFNKGQEEIIGYKFMPLIPEGEREKVLNNIASLNPNAPIITHEHQILNSSGEIRWHKWSNRAIFDNQNNLIEYQAVGWDITKRVKAEEALQKAYEKLEHRVKERTLELNNALETVSRSEKKLLQHKLSLEKLNRELVETNQALSVLARNIDREKLLLENNIRNVIVVNVMPVIAELQKNIKSRPFTAELEVLRDYLSGLISSSSEYHDIIVVLSEQEMRVAALIKKGLTNKNIANILFISEHTVKTHRRNIRKKLKIKNTNINLCSYLKSKLMDQENKI